MAQSYHDYFIYFCCSSIYCHLLVPLILRVSRVKGSFSLLLFFGSCVHWNITNEHGSMLLIRSRAKLLWTKLNSMRWISTSRNKSIHTNKLLRICFHVLDQKLSQLVSHQLSYSLLLIGNCTLQYCLSAYPSLRLSTLQLTEALNVDRVLTNQTAAVSAHADRYQT